MYKPEIDLLGKEFDAFLSFVSTRAPDHAVSFSHPYLVDEEGYKRPLAAAALTALDLDSWRPDLIGRGHILRHVVQSFAARIPWAGGIQPNNLVHWQQIKPFAELPNVADLEHALYDLFKGTEPASSVYERLRAVGATYQIVAFLFFLKDPDRYLPISQERFDKAFRIIGIQGFKTWGAKSWENYATYVEIVGQVRRFLQSKFADEVSLLDAHSFLWVIASQMRRVEKSRADYDKQVSAFQRAWPLERVRSMTLAEYAQAPGNKDSFCYWVAYRTRAAGHLGNTFPATTFGIYHRDPASTSGKSGLHEEAPYLWAEGLEHEHAADAFKEMLGKVVATIEAAQRGDLEAISAIDGYRLFRWKIAHLYAPDKVIPIYHHIHLQAAARELGMEHYDRAIYAARHRFILDHLPEAMDAFQYATDFYERMRVEPERGVRYWVVGSNYQDPGKPSTNIFKDMLRERGVAIGYLWGEDLTDFYLDETKDLSPLVDTFYATHASESKERARRAMPKFMQIAPGDIVAIKGSRYVAESEISIVGYARITERNGVVYRPSPEDYPTGLGHLLNADFFVDDIERRVPVLLQEAVHELSPIKHRDRWQKVFGPVVEQLEAEERAGERSFGGRTPNETSGKRRGVDDLNTNGYWMDGSEGRWVRPLHREMQLSLLAELRTRFPTHDFRKPEEDYIDLRHIDPEGNHHIYELKTDGSPKRCIRQALGQLLSYAALKKENGVDNVRLYIVGPQPADSLAKEFLDYLETEHNVTLEYVHHAVPG